MNHLAKTQPNPISPPREVDRETLTDFSSILQGNLEELFELAHSHKVLLADPLATNGAIGDIQLVDDGTDKYLVARYSDGWYKTANLTAI